MLFYRLTSRVSLEVSGLNSNADAQGGHADLGMTRG